jgi:general secretion pathway protein J
MLPVTRLKGFTLIEMLIAMTLLGVLVVLLFSSLKLAATSWVAGDAKVVAVNKKAVVYQFFKQHLPTIHPLAYLTNTQDPADNQQEQPVFTGNAQHMRFVGALPLSSARKGLQIFEIAAKSDDSSKVMVQLSPYQQTDNVQIDREVLIDHVKSFAFAYFGQTDPSAPAVWTTDWPQSEQLPSLIKVSILLDDISYWPDMVFAVKINQHVAPNQAAPATP